MAPLAPFEKFDLACLLYDRILNKDSYQLIINVFPDATERENLIHRLKLNPADYAVNTNLLAQADPIPVHKIDPDPMSAVIKQNKDVRINSERSVVSSGRTLYVPKGTRKTSRDASGLPNSFAREINAIVENTKSDPLTFPFPVPTVPEDNSGQKDGEASRCQTPNESDHQSQG